LSGKDEEDCRERGGMGTLHDVLDRSHSRQYQTKTPI
jgi:hypothetical protein